MRSPSAHVQKLLGRGDQGEIRINVINRDGNLVILPTRRRWLARPKASDDVFAVPALDRTDESNRRRGKLRDVEFYE